MSRQVIHQPIDLGDGKCHPRSRANGNIIMLRPGAFYWHSGLLYVGYGWLSSFHTGEKPVWDPNPIPLGAVIETCKGYYHFSKTTKVDTILYAEMESRYIHETADIRERIVLPPDYYLEYQWSGGSGGGEQILNRRWCNPKEIMPAIRRASNFDAMRFSREAKKLYRIFTKEKDCIHNLRP